MRTSEVTLRGYRSESGLALVGAEFPSGRVIVQRGQLIAFYETSDAVPMEETPLPDGSHPRTGIGHRTRDVSGVSGEGVVFDFVHFERGWVVQEWRNEENGNLETRGVRDSGMDFRPSMNLAIRIHGHEGGTQYVYDNGEVAEA